MTPRYKKNRGREQVDRGERGDGATLHFVTCVYS